MVGGEGWRRWEGKFSQMHSPAFGEGQGSDPPPAMDQEGCEQRVRGWGNLLMRRGQLGDGDIRPLAAGPRVPVVVAALGRIAAGVGRGQRCTWSPPTTAGVGRGQCHAWSPPTNTGSSQHLAAGPHYLQVLREGSGGCWGHELTQGRRRSSKDA